VLTDVNDGLRSGIPLGLELVAQRALAVKRTW
jgi:hypothetical protein